MMLVAIPAAPLVAAIIARLFRSATLARMATVAASVLTLVLAAVASLVVSHRLTLVALSGWVGINPLAALILLLQSFVGLTAAIYSWSYIPRITGHDVGREQRYFVNLNLFMASLFVVPLLLQPALAWVAVELTTLLSVFLVSFDNTRLALEAAWKYAVITRVPPWLCWAYFCCCGAWFGSTAGWRPGTTSYRLPPTCLPGWLKWRSF